MKGKSYQLGVMNLCYRGNRYKLRDGVISVNVDSSGPYSRAERHEFQAQVFDEFDTNVEVLGLIMIHQYNLKKGLELFGDKAETATVKELKQIHDMGTYVPLEAAGLTPEQKAKALSSLMFIVEKRDGRVKARKCAVGSKQRTFEGYSKAEWASPTVSTDSVLITSAIDAHEGRKVVTCDLPGAYLNTDNNEETIMLLKGKLAELMVKVDPKLYRKYITTNKKGEAMLYVRLSKALYGLLQSALLFYKKLRGELEEYGFEVNPYDPCVANKIVNGSQMTVTWHVDDLKVSHKDGDEITKFLLYLGKLYGNRITVNRGVVHDYLGMDLDFSSPGKLRVSMIKYLAKIFKAFPEKIRAAAATPAADHLFEVRDESERKLLPEEQARAFHHSVAQLLFLSGRARPDIKTAVSFLTTRVKAPDEDDWGKLKRVLKYLWGTRHMKLTLTVDNLHTLRWWVDASYGVHWDAKGHTGMMMSLGEGAAMSFSHRHKLNARSSTEAELIGIDDALPCIMWGLYFIEAQGYEVTHNILFQDNKSTILLAKNGRWSSSKRTKHINNRFFLVKDKIDRGEIEVRHEGTKNMRSDTLSKPLQGRLFCEMRSHLMNCPIEYDDEAELAATHPDLLPTEGWSDPDEDEKVLSAAVQLLVLSSLASRGATPSGHRRSVLEHVRKVQRAVRRARARTRAAGPGAARERRWWMDRPRTKRVHWEPSVVGGIGHGHHGHGNGHGHGIRSIPDRPKSILRRNKYVPMQWNTKKLARSRR
jgi:hypothetical protein